MVSFFSGAAGAAAPAAAGAASAATAPAAARPPRRVDGLPTGGLPGCCGAGAPPVAVPTAAGAASAATAPAAAVTAGGCGACSCLSSSCLSFGGAASKRQRDGDAPTGEDAWRRGVRRERPRSGDAPVDSGVSEAAATGGGGGEEAATGGGGGGPAAATSGCATSAWLATALGWRRRCDVGSSPAAQPPLERGRCLGSTATHPDKRSETRPDAGGACQLRVVCLAKLAGVLLARRGPPLVGLPPSPSPLC